MSNFLFKSKDLYFSDKEHYRYFLNVFDSIERLSVIKNYYQSDLFNIEEILSILEMSSFLEGKRLADEFRQYITAVIKHYTPTVQPYPGNMPGNWYNFVFGKGGVYSDICYFVAHALRAKFSATNEGKRRFYVEPDDSINTRYALLSLNYDLVVENVFRYISHQYESTAKLRLNKESYDPAWDDTHLVKLHGCVESGNIVPPTWAKGTHEEIIPFWKNAYQILRETNHIRILGYSLPRADSYIKYLLKSAIAGSSHLKTIDVICLDPTGSVKQNYEEFLEFSYHRFVNLSIVDYGSGLQRLTQKNLISALPTEVAMNKLEDWHSDFMVGRIDR